MTETNAILAPAIALDLLWQRTRHWKLWQIAIASGIIFVAVIFIVEWPFANFLMSKASANRLSPLCNCTIHWSSGRKQPTTSRSRR